MSVPEAPLRYDASAIATPANVVTVVRMLLAIPFLIWIADAGASYLALFVWIVLAVSDGIDGHLARRDGPTRSGAFLDPLADKVLVLGAMWALVAVESFWWLPVALISIREIGISGVRSYYGRKGISVPARQSAKVKTVVQEVCVGFALLPPAADDASWVATGVLWLAVVLTVGTGVAYWFDGRRSLSTTGDRDDDLTED